MENEENKNVDTQTTDAENNQNDASTAENTQSAENSVEENQEADTEENEAKEVNAEDLSKAFGNSTSTNKNEDEKGKKANSVAKTNEDGSITFKNQEDLNGFINRMFQKGAKSSQRQEQGKQQEEQKQEETNKNSDQENLNSEQSQAIPADYYSSKIGLAMVAKGINFAKVERASRLVDTSKVIVNGAIDEAALNSEIEAISAEFPELKNTTVENNAQAGFKFGASKEEQDASDADAISEAFGNKKG